MKMLIGSCLVALALAASPAEAKKTVLYPWDEETCTVASATQAIPKDCAAKLARCENQRIKETIHPDGDVDAMGVKSYCQFELLGTRP